MTLRQGVAIALLVVSGTTGRASIPTPVAQPRSEPIGPSSLSGVASYYDWKPGQAAAGPDLRDWLGPNWRGQTVQVCNRSGTCLPVVLTDWCFCFRNKPNERLIDLDDATYQKLAPLSTGIMHVSVAAG